MIEIVFSESAYGSLQVSRGYGVGKYQGGAVSVIVGRDDGSEATPEEIRAAQRQAEEKARKAWENAIPLGTKREDMYCFPLSLSVGSISEAEIGEERLAALMQLFSVYPKEYGESQAASILKDAQKSLSAVTKRYAAGEAIRIWYSHDPDEMCGMYWLLATLRPLNAATSIYLVKLPEWEYGEGDTMIRRNSWGEIGPGEWGTYRSRQEEVRPVFLSACAAVWRQLQAENAPLRAVLNGKLQSFPEDGYDSFLLREIETQPQEFPMAVVIGNVLGRYQLGISDAWLTLRIENMITEGKLEIARKPAKEDVSYRCIVRKCKQ